MSESRQSTPGYRDREESRFYRAGGRSPEETWKALGDELSRVLGDADRAFWRASLRIDPERVRWWHGAIFARLFPHDGGRFRRDRAFFGVTTPSGGIRQLEGVAPEAIRGELQTVCSAFNRHVDALGDPEAAAVLDRTRAVAALYAGILRVHPFADGNHRVSFVALSAALWSLGLPNVEFDDDAETIGHDDALVPALVSKDGSIEPFAQLLADLLQRSIESRS
jgi:fido (protein-threonine AMPylation protein)